MTSFSFLQAGIMKKIEVAIQDESNKLFIVSAPGSGGPTNMTSESESDDTDMGRLQGQSSLQPLVIPRMGSTVTSCCWSHLFACLIQLFALCNQ